MRDMVPHTKYINIPNVDIDFYPDDLTITSQNNICNTAIVVLQKYIIHIKLNTLNETPTIPSITYDTRMTFTRYIKKI